MVGVEVLNGHIAREWVMPNKIVIPCMAFQAKMLMYLNLKDHNLNFLIKSTKNF